MIDTDGFWDYLCARGRYIGIGHGLLWVVLGLNTVSYLFVDTTPGTNVILGLNYVGIITALLLSGGVILKCRSRL